MSAYPLLRISEGLNLTKNDARFKILKHLTLRFRNSAKNMEFVPYVILN